MCQTPIGTLPDELLLMIFELLARPFSLRRGDYFEEYDTTIKGLGAVCRRFNRLATPLRYRTIIVGPLHEARTGLYRVDPSYRQFYQNIRLRISDVGFHVNMSKADWRIATDFFAGCTKVRCLEIHGGFGEHKQELWDFIVNILKHTRGLQQLSLSREGGYILLPHIMRFIDESSLQDLQVLEVHGVADRGEGLGPVPHWYSNKASFTTLKLSDYDESPAATIRLIQWPRELHHFHFMSFYNNPYFMDLKMFGGWLWNHKDSLQTIDIGYLSKGGELCDVSQFPKLTSLTLSRWSFSDDLESPESDALCLLAPNLESFTWDFSIYDQHDEPWDAFGEREERWLDEFTKVASSRSSPLKVIKVIFNPDYWFSTEEDGYPWDRLERVKERCRPLGISLQYSVPCLSKEAWLVWIKGREGLLAGE